MDILKKFYPGEYQDSTYNIDFEDLSRQGYRGLIFDIDNTLVPHGAPADERAIALFARLKSLGYRCCLLSNNQKERVDMFNRDVHVFTIENAHKPMTANYKRAMELMGTDVRNTIFIGDQLFTDVFGANRAGIRTILVKPIHPKEEIQIVLKRYLERIVLFFYRRHVLAEKGSSLILTGMMGTGKTTVGEALSKAADMPLVDTDDLIRTEEGREIREIFEQDGEGAFRDMETKLLQRLLGSDAPRVISAGGGMPVREENRRMMKQLGTVIWLDASEETLRKRLAEDQSRPLLSQGKADLRIRELKEQRERFYLAASDVHIMTDNRSPEEIAAQILGLKCKKK